MSELKICLLCDTLKHGGAETHICTLANALAARGHAVTVVSGGGALAASLSGVAHVRLPLPRKRYAVVAFFSLWRLFRRERFDVIHAHTRYTAALARPLAGGRLVTTAHWVFDTAFPRRQLSAWGARTLAVSEDIKRYLINEYGLPEAHITVTVNGIDGARFAPKEKGHSARRRIVYVSRLSPDRAAAAFALLDACAYLPPEAFSLTLVGDGASLGGLKEKAAALTARDGRYDIRFTGAITAVEKELAEADIFVGVSRAALEAMAAGCAVILAGNEGYLSVFSPADAKRAEETNFCCRGATRVSAKALYGDLTALISLSRDALLRMGEANRRYACTQYGTARMVRDALSVYQRICKARAVLCGYYGFHNVGDTLLHHALRRELKRAGYGRIHTLSAKKLSPLSLFTVWRRYDFFLGGGNLLQDATSRRSLSFYLFFLRLALWRGCRVCLLSSGFGPLSHEGEGRVCTILSRCDTIVCRTRGDALCAKRLGAKRVVLAADAVLSLPITQKEKKGDRILLSFRTPPEEDACALTAFVLRLSYRFDAKNLCLFAMHPTDAPFLERLAALTGIRYFSGSAGRFLSVLEGCACAFGSRLHLGVCALACGVPFFLWEGDEKCRRFVRDVKSVSEKAFCGLFSFSDRPASLPSPDGMQSTKEKLCERYECL
ncbi:MAG: glycosyltransferase [Clostridia bacterium]|nr:glycosyltransferase [Clostridia bacterium]